MTGEAENRVWFSASPACVWGTFHKIPLTADFCHVTLSSGKRRDGFAIIGGNEKERKDGFEMHKEMDCLFSFASSYESDGMRAGS